MFRMRRHWLETVSAENVNWIINKHTTPIMSHTCFWSMFRILRLFSDTLVGIWLVRSTTTVAFKFHIFEQIRHRSIGPSATTGAESKGEAQEKHVIGNEVESKREAQAIGLSVVSLNAADTQRHWIHCNKLISCIGHQFHRIGAGAVVLVGKIGSMTGSQWLFVAEANGISFVFVLALRAPCPYWLAFNYMCR